MRDLYVKMEALVVLQPDVVGCTLGPCWVCIWNLLGSHATFLSAGWWYLLEKKYAHNGRKAFAIKFQELEISSQENEKPLLETSKTKSEVLEAMLQTCSAAWKNVTARLRISLSFELLPCRLVLDRFYFSCVT